MPSQETLFAFRKFGVFNAKCPDSLSSEFLKCRTPEFRNAEMPSQETLFAFRDFGVFNAKYPGSLSSELSKCRTSECQNISAERSLVHVPLEPTTMIQLDRRPTSFQGFPRNLDHSPRVLLDERCRSFHNFLSREFLSHDSFSLNS
jgi:hypothetical protein